MKKYIFLLVLPLLVSCGKVSVEHHWGFGWPDTWEVTDGDFSINYYNGNCCCVAEEVMEELAYLVNNSELDWEKMKDNDFKKKVLADICWHAKNMPETLEFNKRRSLW